jgi:hypothetical protein
MTKTTQRAARKRQKLRRLDARVSISELDMVDRWVEKNRTNRSTIVRDCLELMRRHLEQLERAEIETSEAAARARLEISQQSRAA